MKSLIPKWKGVFPYTLLTVFLALAFGICVLNPLWEKLATPGLFPSQVFPPVTAPIDGLYYILNAQNNYSWGTQDPLSLWFHPLLVLLLKIVPEWPSLNYWFWIISIISGVACLILIHRLTVFLKGETSFSPWKLLLCLLAPGGLSLAVGNAEIPVLLLNLSLLLSVLVWRNTLLTTIFAALAILTKPNALYMVPILLTYVIFGLEEKNDNLWKQALIGLVTILLFWLLWAWYVGTMTGSSGAYWEVRLLEKQYLDTGDFATYVGNFISAFQPEPNIRDLVRYTSALVVPFSNLILLGLIPLKEEKHRYAFAAGNLAMLAIFLYLGNPNKIIVYSVTLPGHFSSHLLFLDRASRKQLEPIPRRTLFKYFLYNVYCLIMLVVFVIGTPLRWYH